MQADTPYLRRTPGALFQTHAQHLFQIFYRRVCSVSAEVGKRLIQLIWLAAQVSAS